MTREEIFAAVRGHVVQIVDGLQPDMVREEVSMRDLGADSLQVVEVVSRSMKQLRLKIPRTELSRAKNLGDLVDLFEQAARNATTA
jgi:acyl carrier protein